MGVNVSYTFKDQDKRQNPLNLANKIPCIGRAYDDNGNFILNLLLEIVLHSVLYVMSSRVLTRIIFVRNVCLLRGI